jgi:hypothetical protein
MAGAKVAEAGRGNPVGAHRRRGAVGGICHVVLLPLLRPPATTQRARHLLQLPQSNKQQRRKRKPSKSATRKESKQLEGN